MCQRYFRTKLFFPIFAVLATSFLLPLGCNKPSIRESPFARWKTDADDSSFANKKTESNDAIQQASFEARDSSGQIAFAGGAGAGVTLTVWHESYEEAMEASRQSGKPILADFTGTDWCPWCVKLKKDVFETAVFKEWARENVVLLELDYPKRSSQRPAIKKRNQQLKDKYQISTWPTVLFLDQNGEVLGKLGYKKDPNSWIKTAESMLNR